MKKIIFLSLVATFAFANHLTYNIKAPLLGSEGKVEIDYYHTSTRYSIKAKLSTLGFAKKVTGNRQATYISKGFISSNRYKSKKFIGDTSYKNKKRINQYNFNYTKRKITKSTKAWKDNKLVKDTKRVLDYFTYNDFFTAYHNIVAELKYKPAGYYQMEVAGMEKYGKYLKVYIPPKKQQQKEAKELDVDNVWVFHMLTKRRILGSKSGELIVAVGDDGIAKAVRVLDIPFVSHLDAILVR